VLHVQLSPYALRARGQANTTRKGALLKVEFGAGAFGYTDCHLWPELGDPTLDEMISIIRSGAFDHPFFQNMLTNAFVDLRSRESHCSVNLTEKPLLNHYLFRHIDDLDPVTLDKLEEEGFTHIKLKVGRDIHYEIDQITRFLCNKRPFQLRLDFNALTSKESYIKTMKQLTDSGANIDFCEDPFPFDYDEWKQVQELTGVPIAADRYAAKLLEHSDFPFVVIIKPAIDDVEKIAGHLHGKQFVVTSYLDHPVGQVMAAYHAQSLDLKFPHNAMCHGLLSHHVYEQTSYSTQLAEKGPAFTFPQGNGVGFEDLLREEEWVD
jgi:o-succinylbenzoate synthase